jgi:hypothetical protein
MNLCRSSKALFRRLAVHGVHTMQLAERFSQAVRKARAELGQGGNFASIVGGQGNRSGSRERFGDAVPGPETMWPMLLSCRTKKRSRNPTELRNSARR